jgi:hypothetical protein
MKQLEDSAFSPSEDVRGKPPPDERSFDAIERLTEFAVTHGGIHHLVLCQRAVSDRR